VVRSLARVTSYTEARLRVHGAPVHVVDMDFIVQSSTSGDSRQRRKEKELPGRTRPGATPRGTQLPHTGRPLTPGGARATHGATAGTCATRHTTTARATCPLTPSHGARAPTSGGGVRAARATRGTIARTRATRHATPARAARGPSATGRARATARTHATARAPAPTAPTRLRKHECRGDIEHGERQNQHLRRGAIHWLSPLYLL
jgi:hypothetical protein